MPVRMCRVCVTVDLHVDLLVKALPTVRTYVRLEIGVCSHMGVQIRSSEIKQNYNEVCPGEKSVNSYTKIVCTNW